MAIGGKTMETVADIIFWDSIITTDGDCSHETKRSLLLGRKVMTNLESILKSRDITLSTKVPLVKAMVFKVVMHGCECWTIKKAEHWRIEEDSWESLGLQGDPASPSSRRSVLVVHWKDWSWTWNSNNLTTWCEELTHLKRPWFLERMRAGGEGDDRGWDCWMASPTQWTWVWIGSGSWFGQGGLACYSSWGCIESDMTEWLNWTALNLILTVRLLTYTVYMYFLSLARNRTRSDTGWVLKCSVNARSGIILSGGIPGLTICIFRERIFLKWASFKFMASRNIVLS